MRLSFVQMHVQTVGRVYAYMKGLIRVKFAIVVSHSADPIVIAELHSARVLQPGDAVPVLPNPNVTTILKCENPLQHPT